MSLIDRKNIDKYLELLFFITLRQIKVRYKQTVLGIGWVVLRPFLMMVVFTFVFSKLARIGSDGIPYPIFSYSALLPWTFFSASLTSSISSLVSQSSLIKQIYFPREIFPLAATLAGLFDFAVSSVVFVGMLFFYRIPFTPMMIYVFPLLLMTIVFILSLSYFLSALNVYYRDIGQATSFALQLLMFSTPVVYSVSMIPEKYKFLYMLNPMAVIIDGFRRVTIQGVTPDWFYMGIAALVMGVMFLFAYRYFKKMEMSFADVI